MAFVTFRPIIIVLKNSKITVLNFNSEDVNYLTNYQKSFNWQ